MNAQMGLFDRPLARKRDPQTSHAAAERSDEFRGKHESKIFGYLLEHPEGATYRQIAAGVDLEPVAVGRRMKALCERAGVYADGQRDGMQVWKVRRAD
jgi:hypothetical protein